MAVIFDNRLHSKPHVNAAYENEANKGWRDIDRSYDAEDGVSRLTDQHYNDRDDVNDKDQQGSRCQPLQHERFGSVFRRSKAPHSS